MYQGCNNLRQGTAFKSPLGSSVQTTGQPQPQPFKQFTLDREASLILNTSLEVSVQLHALTDLPLDRTAPPPPPIIHFYIRLFVPTASKDVEVTM